MKILYVFIFGIGIRNIFKMNRRGPPKGPKHSECARTYSINIQGAN